MDRQAEQSNGTHPVKPLVGLCPLFADGWHPYTTEAIPDISLRFSFGVYEKIAGIRAGAKSAASPAHSDRQLPVAQWFYQDEFRPKVASLEILRVKKTR